MSQSFASLSPPFAAFKLRNKLNELIKCIQATYILYNHLLNQKRKSRSTYENAICGTVRSWTLIYIFIRCKWLWPNLFFRALPFFSYKNIFKTEKTQFLHKNRNWIRWFVLHNFLTYSQATGILHSMWIVLCLMECHSRFVQKHCKKKCVVEMLAHEFKVIRSVWNPPTELTSNKLAEMQGTVQ